jgi:hypothetical protein
MLSKKNKNVQHIIILNHCGSGEPEAHARKYLIYRNGPALNQ